MSPQSQDDWVPGIWVELLTASMVKRWLEATDLPVAERLELLEWLYELPDTKPYGGPSPEKVAAVPPANDAVAEVVEQAWRLNTDEVDHANELLGRASVFANLMKLQPALAAAVMG
jgi:hypothetical protein